MPNRRKFVRLSLLSSFGLLAGQRLFAKKELNENQILPAVKDKPVVISTWNFGKEANAAAWEVLDKGGKAIDAVETGVRLPEGDIRNQAVGIGGRPDRDGHVTLDACIMDENSKCGAVAFLQHIAHPISVARLVKEKTPHIMLVGDGALKFALENGFKKENLLTEKSKKDWQEWKKSSKYKPNNNIENELPGGEKNHDTIGMVALDKYGDLSGACTTSGIAYKMYGRVGDSPIIGAGLYVDNEVGAATCTGMGEEVIRIVGAHLIVELMRQGLSPEAACKKAAERVATRNPERAKEVQVAFIALNKKGEYGAYALQKGFQYAVRNGEVEAMYDAKSLF
jgi:N4-(beta-N-acetylglucosaminyl)-L-asparaginase